MGPLKKFSRRQREKKTLSYDNLLQEIAADSTRVWSIKCREIIISISKICNRDPTRETNGGEEFYALVHASKQASRQAGFWLPRQGVLACNAGNIDLKRDKACSVSVTRCLQGSQGPVCNRDNKKLLWWRSQLAFAWNVNLWRKKARLNFVVEFLVSFNNQTSAPLLINYAQSSLFLNGCVGRVE